MLALNNPEKRVGAATKKEEVAPVFQMVIENGR